METQLLRPSPWGTSKREEASEIQIDKTLLHAISALAYNDSCDAISLYLHMVKPCMKSLLRLYPVSSSTNKKE